MRTGFIQFMIKALLGRTSIPPSFDMKSYAHLASPMEATPLSVVLNEPGLFVMKHNEQEYLVSVSSGNMSSRDARLLRLGPSPEFVLSLPPKVHGMLSTIILGGSLVISTFGFADLIETARVDSLWRISVFPIVFVLCVYEALKREENYVQHFRASKHYVQKRNLLAEE